MIVLGFPKGFFQYYHKEIFLYYRILFIQN